MKNFKNNLSRNEMRTIYAGNNGEGTAPIGAEGTSCLKGCKQDSECTDTCRVCKWWDGAKYCFSS